MRAEEGGYAVGAFNVYNLEGAMAVVAAAEAENSPAILQIHPGALNHGGYPLVSCCIAAAKHAKVWPPYPISLHFFIVWNLLKKIFLGKHAHIHTC
jgi:fructose/tagatose bisphosphate aldolase